MDGEACAYLIADDVGDGKGDAQRKQGDAAGGEHGEGSGVGGEIEYLGRGRGAHQAHAQHEMLGDDDDFSNLVCEERVRHIIEKAEFYGHCGKRVKGLIFCRRNDEARELSSIFNRCGYRTVAVSGQTPVEARMEYVRRLQQDRRDGNELDYILSVDVFNEGVDIPGVNQIIMLRPTQSSIVFIQQLGRGLRKKEGKDFVVVIDFIANYKNNFLIPVALSGDVSYNKDNLRRDALECNRLIPGCSTVSFEPVARQLIYKKIDEANFSATAFLKEHYLELKNKIGRIPTIRDFREDHSVDIQRYVDASGSYYAFVRKVEKNYRKDISEAGERLLSYVSLCFSQGKRKDELEVLADILSKAEDRDVSMASEGNAYSWLPSSVRSNLDLTFAKDVDRNGRFLGCEILSPSGSIAPGFREMLKSHDFRMELFQIVEDGLERNRTTYSRRYKDTGFTLFEKYTYEDACRLLGWKKNETAQNIGGYKFDSFTHTLPVFINYEKSDKAIQYEDRFVSPRQLIALSKSGRNVDSKDADHIYKRTEDDRNNRIYLFVRKNKDADGKKEFYFLGEINATGHPEPVKVDGKKAFEITYELEHPIRKDIYDYLTTNLN